MKVCLFLTLLFSSSAYAAKCMEYDVRIIFDKNPVTTKDTLCYMVNPRQKIEEFVSVSCLERKCEILQRKKEKLPVKDYYSQTGSPGFKLCSALGGVPQIAEFTNLKRKWAPLERCLFNKDFVEISMLTREWKDFIIKQ